MWLEVNTNKKMEMSADNTLETSTSNNMDESNNVKESPTSQQPESEEHDQNKGKYKLTSDVSKDTRCNVKAIARSRPGVDARPRRDFGLEAKVEDEV